MAETDTTSSVASASTSSACETSTPTIISRLHAAPTSNLARKRKVKLSCPL